ncbi:MAG: RluA family pseudouridine synthase [Pyrinomonadaceae bacterium]|nr:RluA family pseudouridine synthase [Pyrinomonadaceae bacterium]
MPNNIETLKFTTNPDSLGIRLDIFLSENIETWSRSRLKKLIDDGDVLVNGRAIKSSYKLRENDEITVELTERESDTFEPEEIPIEIVFEDDYLAVINKPAGMVVHPGAGVSSGTLANAIAWHFKFQVPESDGSRISNRIGIVHRLDKDTSGLIVVAKNELTHEKLAAQFHDRRVKKSYVALVHGFVRKLTGKIDAPIARARSNRVKMAVDKNGRNAVSIYKVRQRFERFTLLDVDIKTGRTHQIRVHLAHINHPIVGDKTYNGGRDKQIPDALLRKAIREIDRFYLHAEKLSFTHPVTKEQLEFTQTTPDELNRLLSML